MVTVGNCESFEILLTPKVDKLPCDTFMDAGRRYEAPGLENSLIPVAIVVTRAS